MRLIDADALKEKLTELGWINNNPYNGDNMIEEIIDNTPTVELPVAIGIPIMRPIGHWIKNAEPWDYQNPPFICSECGNPHLFDTPYCEICGADMRGDV